MWETYSGGIAPYQLVFFKLYMSQKGKLYEHNASK